jgi:hypothetical protein
MGDTPRDTGDTPVDNFIYYKIPVCSVVSVLLYDQNFPHILEVFYDSFDLTYTESCNGCDALDAGP